METNFKKMNPDCRLLIGERTTLRENIVFGPNCRNIKIGFGCFLGRDLYIDIEELSIGDYTTIHHGSILHGKKTEIGSNCWIGHYSIIDSLGGFTKICNNVGIGAHSQVWSHMKFGDVLAGCQWNSSGSVLLEDDVWLVGHTIIGPIHAKEKSMLMTGGVAIKNMEANCIYAGSPASDVSGRLGRQFIETTFHEKKVLFDKLKDEYTKVTGRPTSSFVSVDSFSPNVNVTQFNLEKRTYIPRYCEEEYHFMKFLLYDKAKFIPVSE